MIPPSSQDRFLDDLNRLVEAQGLELVVDKRFGTHGVVSILKRGQEEPVVEFEFEFQGREARFTDLPEHIGKPSGVMGYRTVSVGGLDKVLAWLDARTMKATEDGTR